MLKVAMKKDQDFQRFSSICLRTVTDVNPDGHGDNDQDKFAHLLTSLEDGPADFPIVSQANQQDVIAGFVSLLNDRIMTADDDVSSIFGRQQK